MTRTLTLICALLAGCAVVGTEARLPDPEPAASQPLVVDGIHMFNLATLDVRGTSVVTAALLDLVQDLPREERAELAASVRALSVDCAYTRASIQLPLALHKMVMAVQFDKIDPFVQTDWAYLRRGLNAHVALLEALDMPLGTPQIGDHLYDAYDTDVTIDAATLLAADDPIAATQPLLASIQAFTKSRNSDTIERIEAHGDRLRAITGQGQVLKTPVTGWTYALRRIEPFLTDAAVKAQVTAMLDALSVFEDENC